VFSHPIEISASDIDHLGHVNNAVYIQWAQKLAETYWSSIAPPDLYLSRLWIALQHQIKYMKPAFMGDDICGKLVFGEYKGVRALFDVQFMRGSEILASVQSWWCSIDTESRRPIRLPLEFIKKHLAD
jgi:acyl-CoA thioester hydrolase